MALSGARRRFRQLTGVSSARRRGESILCRGGGENQERLARPAAFRGLRPRSSDSDSAGVKVTASASEVSRAAVMVMARARKKLPVTPVVAISGRKTTTGVMVEKTSGVDISRMARRTASVRD